MTDNNHPFNFDPQKNQGSAGWYLMMSGQLDLPVEFSTMEHWFEYLNENEEQTYQLIHDHNGFIGFIKNPSDKQVRVHQMAHVL